MEKYRSKLAQMNYDEQEFVKKGATYHKQWQNMPHYAAMVESMDENVGHLLQVLDQENLSENTIVVFTSDNGGMSTSIRTDNIPTTNLPLRTGKGYLYEGGIREPLIFRWPVKIEAGSSTDFPATGTDLYPTLLDLSGIKLKPQQHKDGISLKPLLEGRKIKERPLFWHYPHYSGGLGGRPSGAVRLGDYKLIEFFEDNRIELYNLKSDIEEKTDLTKDKPEKAEELKELLHQWRKNVGAQMPFPNPAYIEQE